MSNDILLEEVRTSALSVAEGGLREKPGGGAGVLKDEAGGGEMVAWAAAAAAAGEEADREKF